jgi:putative DNA primase/helicase
MTAGTSAIEPKSSTAADGAKRRPKAVTRTAIDVAPRKVEWLLHGLIPFGALTVLAGQPGLGKSLLTVKIAADFSAGRLGERGDVLMLTAEDPVAEVVVPRLKAARAKLSTVRFPADTKSLEAIESAHGVRLVVIDPLSAHLATGVDSFKDQSIREALAPLAALAEDGKLAVVLVAHLNKGQGTDPLQRLGGSIGLPAAARSVLLLGRDPGDPAGASGARRVLAQVKNNFGEHTGSSAYSIGSTTIEGLFEEIPVGYIVDVGPSPYRGAELLALAQEADEPAMMREAAEFLKVALADGPRAAADLQDEAEKAGLSWDTVKRAKRRAGVTGQKERGIKNGRWLWQIEALTVTELPAA